MAFPMVRATLTPDRLRIQEIGADLRDDQERGLDVRHDATNATSVGFFGGSLWGLFQNSCCKATSKDCKAAKIGIYC